MRGFKNEKRLIDQYLKNIRIKKGDDVNEINTKLRGYLKLRDTSYLANDFTHNWICNCGEIFQKKWSNIRERSEYKCQKCVKNGDVKVYKETIEAHNGFKLKNIFWKGTTLPNGEIKKTSEVEVMIGHVCGKEELITLKKWNNRKNKCTDCQIPYEKSFAYYIIEILNMKLEDIWVSEHNKDLNPYNLTYKSNRKVMLKCKKGILSHPAKEKIISDFYKNKGCYYCGNDHVELEGSIGYQIPKIAKMIVDDVDIYKISVQSNKNYNLKCDKCGYIVNKKICNIYNQGFSCRRCSDYKPITEKFMLYILAQLNIPYEYQKKFKWSKGKIYDFYFEDIKCILEIDGEQHKKELKTWKNVTFKDVKENDEVKNKLARENGFNIIRVDAYKSNLEHLTKSYSEVLQKVFGDNICENIDFNLAWEKSQKSLVVLSWNLWKLGKNIVEIAKITKLARVTIIDYLKRGNELGIVNYSPKNQMKKSAMSNRKIYGYIVTWKDETLEFNCGSNLVRILKFKKYGLKSILKNGGIITKDVFEREEDQKYIGGKVQRINI